MKKCTTLILTCLTLASFGTWEAKAYQLQDNLTDPEKKKTAIIAESKKADAQVQAELDALLLGFIEEAEAATINSLNSMTSQILTTAFDYEGVRYRYGGMSRKGMDCSGLIMTAFGETDIDLPRTSLEMAKVGERVTKTNAQVGDLIFFKTRGNRISHVGIITEVIGDEIKFIHSSTSRGVIVSSTKENYYNRTFAQINRVLL